MGVEEFAAHFQEGGVVVRERGVESGLRNEIRCKALY